MNLAMPDIDGDSQAIRQEGAEKGMLLSVVIPISERHDDLQDLYLQYSKELSTYGDSCEFIFVLDGPDSAALRALRAIKRENPGVIIIVLNRWFGEATALAVGFERSKGQTILTLSSYFQVEPQEIGRILSELAENGKDLVISWRNPRIDSFFNRIQSRVFHWITRLLTGRQYHDISCGLKAMKRRVAEEIPIYGDLHRFFPLLAYQKGFKISELMVRQSSHDLKSRVLRPGMYLRRLLDILTFFFVFKFTKKPLRFFGLLGSGLFGCGGIIMAYLGVYRMLNLGPIAGRPLLILGVLLVVLGIQLLSIGLLGEIIIFTHARGERDYQIEEILD